MALANKVALVTGGAQGISYSTSQQLLKAGAKVTIIDMSEEVLSQSCKLLSDDYGADRVLGYPCDITNKQVFEKAFERTKEQFGSIDILVNNAGICNLTDWEKNLLVNLHGTMFGAYKAIDYMSTQKGGNGGVIINVASVIGVLPVPLANGSYSVSKSGIIAFSRSLPVWFQ
jgi:15-hydroxyprostaglandin dehydrogenase (NAD)